MARKKACKLCGKMKIPISSNRFYCSPKCAREANRRMVNDNYHKKKDKKSISYTLEKGMQTYGEYVRDVKNGLIARGLKMPSWWRSI